MKLGLIWLRVLKISIQKLRYLETFTVLFPDFFNNSSYKLLSSLSKKRSAHFRKFSILFKFYSKPKKRFNLTRALSCLEADLEMLLISRLKLSWSSMCIPSNLINQGTSRTWFPIKSCFGLLVWLLFWIKIDLDLSGLIIILFSENHLIAFWDLAISISTSKVTDFANNDNALSSAKLCTDAFLKQKKKSFKNALNNTGPAILNLDIFQN